ncbi:MAG: hypothetical protein LBQ79_00445 [Deltaproteobacteria bacterium]|jgi:hypothetical protein|nr:hypothetical protein [Deltaproteobacteria bacterium]
MRDPMEAMEDGLSRFPRPWAVYVRLNFCKGELADGTPKPPNRFYDLFYHLFYLKCPCCAALRGMLAGLVLGLGVSWLW